MSLNDTESLKKQAVVDFSTRRKSMQPTKASPKDKNKEEARKKLENAKVNAQKEIDIYRNAIMKAKDDIKDLALFHKVSDLLDQIFIKSILEDTVEPLVKGNMPPLADADDFKEARKELFRELISKYEKK